MKASLLMGVLLLGAGPLAAADHPTVLLVQRGDQATPVVGVVGTDPVIELSGKKTRLSDNVSFSAERAPYFADGFVELSGVSLMATQLGRVMIPDAVNTDQVRLMPGKNFFAADLKPSVEVRGGFIVIITFSPAFLAGTSEKSLAQIVVHDLPTLPPKVATHVEFTNARTAGGQFIMLVFAAGGAELKSNIAPDIAEYFSRIERLRLAAAIARYREDNLGKDHGATPFVLIPPTLPTGTARPSRKITATVTVKETGVVEDITIAGTEDGPLEANIRDALSGWLFLPRLKAGAPVAARVAIPLTFPDRDKKPLKAAGESRKGQVISQVRFDEFNGLWKRVRCG